MRNVRIMPMSVKGFIIQVTHISPLQTWGTLWLSDNLTGFVSRDGGFTLLCDCVFLREYSVILIVAGRWRYKSLAPRLLHLPFGTVYLSPSSFMRKDT